MSDPVAPVPASDPFRPPAPLDPFRPPTPLGGEPEAAPHDGVAGPSGDVPGSGGTGASKVVGGVLEAKLRKQLDALLEGKSLVPKGGNSPRAEPI